MKAAVVERYGPPEVVSIREVPDPTVGDGSVLVRVKATAVNSGDARVRALRVPAGMTMMMRLAMGFSKPRQSILGFEMAGVVERVGRDVTGFRVGDRVVGSRGFSFGCHAEVVAVEGNGVLTKIPDGMSFDNAVSLLFGGATTLDFFSRSGVTGPGQSILINAASGAVGTMAVQIAKDLGMSVTGVCSGRNADLVRSLGADAVIDYTKEDFTQTPQRFDFVMDNHGNAPFGRVKHLLKPGGRYMMVIGDLWQMMGAAGNKAIVSGTGKDAVTAEVYAKLLAMAAEGRLRPVIDSVYPFEQIVEAHRRVDTGRKVGSVVVTVP